MKRLIVGLSGASGAIYGVRLLQVLRNVAEVETHLVMSQAARQTLSLETDLSLRDVQALADVVHDARDIAASISSGSFKTAGMVILRAGNAAASRSSAFNDPGRRTWRHHHATGSGVLSSPDLAG